MEPASQAPTAMIAQPLHKPIHLQSIEDFEREQAALDVLKVSQVKPTPQPLPKRAKNIIDAESLAAEQRARDEIGEANWVGKLLEYRNAHPVLLPGLKYDPVTIESRIVRFTCTVIIAESLQKFGGDPLSFSNKKDAKQHAAKKAIDWLIANQHMPSDGSVKFPKPAAPIQVPQEKKRNLILPSDPAIPANGSPITTTYASQIPALCNKLGFAPPKYEITRAKAGDVPFFNGYADFGGDPRIEGKVGEVFNVYGQKRAKEQIAQVVYSFLKDIERQRGEPLEYDDRKRKRSSESLEEGEEDSEGKIVKVADD